MDKLKFLSVILFFILLLGLVGHFMFYYEFPSETKSMKDPAGNLIIFANHK